MEPDGCRVPNGMIRTIPWPFIVETGTSNRITSGSIKLDSASSVYSQINPALYTSSDYGSPAGNLN